MTTRDNIKQILQSLAVAEVEKAIYKDGDYVKLILHIANVGSYATIEGTKYDSADYNETAGSGNVYTDKDDFMNMIKECNITKFDDLM